MKFIEVILLVVALFQGIDGAASESAAIPEGLRAVEVAESRLKKDSGSKALVEKGRLLFYRAVYSQEKDREAIYQDGLSTMERVLKEFPEDPGALFWWCAISSRLSLIQSKLVALKRLPEFEKTLLKVRSLDPSYHFFGPDRALAALYHAAPGFISIGSDAKARVHYETALKEAPDYPGNRVAYAEFLKDEGEKEKAMELVKNIAAPSTLSAFPVERFEWERAISKILGD